MGIFGNVRTGNGYECNGIAWKHVKYRGFGQLFKRKQTISLVLDLVAGKLSFTVNGTLNDTLTYNNLANGNYRLAATLLSGQTIEILETRKIWVFPNEMKAWGNGSR